jgi:uncharacterized protein YqhQ
MKNEKTVSVGGQAVIEGVMMKGKDTLATAVRRPTGEIVYKVTKLKPSMNFLSKIPFIRGGVILFETLILGTKELSFSANEAGEEEEKLGDKELMLTVVAALALGVGLFMVLPSIVGGFLFKDNRMHANIFEGILRILFFLIYIKLISLSKDIKRVFEYHGAEHKCIYAFENNEELKKENAIKYTTLHPRCGTSFLLIVMLISIIVFSATDFLIPQPDNMWLKMGLKIGLRIGLMPLVAGLAYEFQKYSSKHLENPFYKLIAVPGLSLQKLTTKEPDVEQLEVSMVALRVALGLEVDNATEVFE